MENKKKNTHGGKRPNAGRKTKLPPEEKKVPIFIYPRQIEVDSLGGKDEVKAICEAHLTKLHKKTLK